MAEMVMEKSMNETVQVFDLEHNVDTAGTMEFSRVPASVVATAVKAVSDVVVSLINNHKPN